VAAFGLPSGSERVDQFVQHTVVGFAPAADPVGVPPLGAPHIAALGVPGDETFAPRIDPPEIAQLGSILQFGPSPLSVEVANTVPEQSDAPKASTMGSQVPALAEQVHGVQCRSSVIVSKITVACK
jgi:hypothetical protein